MKEKINFLEQKLKNSRSDMEKAELSDKIAQLKAEEAKTDIKAEKVINEHADINPVIDHGVDERPTVLTRGQIVNNSSSFSIGL